MRDPIGRNPNFSSAPMEEITAFQIARKSTKIDRFRSRVLKRNFSGLRISEERDSRFTKSRTAVSLIPGQLDVVDFRLPG